MSVRFVVLVLFSLVCGVMAQEIPESNPSEVWVKGRKVDHSWRQGRIWVPTSQLQPLLNLPSEMPVMDLVKTLQDRGGYIWSVRGGKFEAKPDPSNYSREVDPAAAARNREKAELDNHRRQTELATQPGKLYYTVREFTADTGFVRAYVRVFNQGPNDSDPTTVKCYFTDGFGKPYAEQSLSVPAFAAGEGDVYEIFSIVREKDTSIKMTKDNVLCVFLSQKNPNLNPGSEREARQQARERKR